MNRFCPSCQKESEWIEIEHPEIFDVRGESIEVFVKALQCSVCQAEYEDLNSTYDPYVLAYKEYRKRKGMVQPEEIKMLRTKYHLTQKELGDILGFGDVSLSRYENGSLQDEVHDKMLQLAMDPVNLWRLLQEKFGALSPNKLLKVTELLRKETVLYDCFRNFLTNELSIYTGNVKADIHKIVNMVKYFLHQKIVVKTKLLKEMFYSDFKHFKSYGFSISGLIYITDTYGPVPKDFEKLLLAVQDVDSSIQVDIRPYGEHIGYDYSCSTPPDLSFFSTDEINTLGYIMTSFKALGAKDLSDRSHKEKAYLETSAREPISYALARDLSV